MPGKVSTGETAIPADLVFSQFCVSTFPASDNGQQLRTSLPAHTTELPESSGRRRYLNLSSTTTTYAIAVVVSAVHLVSYVVPGPWSLLEFTSPMSFVNCTDNAVRPFLPEFPKLSLFCLTNASFCRDHRAHRSEPRVNRRPDRLQSHSRAWNWRLERPLL